MALWFNAPALDRKIEGSNLAANFSFERTTMTREKRGDEFGNEDRKKARPQNERPLTRETSALNEKRLDPKILSVNEKGLDSKDVDVDERPLTQKQKHLENMKQERTRRRSWRK